MKHVQLLMPEQSGDRFAAAAALARQLHEKLAGGARGKRVGRDFARLSRLIEALPLDVERTRIGFLRQWTVSARELATRGEIGACRLQLRQVGLVIERLQRQHG